MVLVHQEELHAHERRMDSHEAGSRRVEDKLDGLRNWIMASLLTGIGACLGIIAQLLAK